MSLYGDAIDFGLSAIEATGGEKITYRDGSADLCFTCVPEEKSEQRAVVGGNRITSTTRTQAFLIRPKYLKKNGSQFKPARGHLIQRPSGQWYRVQQPDGGPVWEWGSGQRIHYRVFAVEISDPV